MYSTAKEVHVYIDGTIQVLSSNRKQSIHPQLLDMFLNNATVEYISSKFPNGYNAKDVESTLKRSTDISMLKSSLKSVPFINMESLYPSMVTPKPYNAIKIQSVTCSYIRPFGTRNANVGIKYIGVIDINDSMYTDSSFTLSIKTVTNGVETFSTINLTNILNEVKSASGMFYFYDNFVDVLRNTYGLNVNYESSIANGNRRIIIEPLIGTVISHLTSNSSKVFCKIITQLVTVPTGLVTGVSACSIHSDLDAKVALGDFYRSRNLHLDPIAETDKEGVNVYYTDFLPLVVVIDYIRKPKLFNIVTGQVPEIVISKDFLDFAIKQISLVVNSPSYDKIVNETIKNS